MNKRKRVLIISVDRQLATENMEFIRRQVMEQVNEGVLVIPPWCTATVANLDVPAPEPIISVNL